MHGLLAFADRLERVPQLFGKAGAWLILPLIGIIIFDVVTRKFQFMQQAIMNSPLYEFMSPTKLQEMEWHLHAGLLYLKGVAPNSVKIQSIYRGIVPFVALQVMGLVACMIWPAITLWLPNLILE